MILFRGVPLPSVMGCGWEDICRVYRERSRVMKVFHCFTLVVCFSCFTIKVICGRRLFVYFMGKMIVAGFGVGPFQRVIGGNSFLSTQPANDQRVMDQSKVIRLAVKGLVDAGYSIFFCQIFFLFSTSHNYSENKASWPKSKSPH